MKRPGIQTLFPVAVALASLWFCAALGASDLQYRVVLLRPTSTDEIAAEALARVVGELTAANFEVVIAAQPSGIDARTAVETVGRDVRPIAAFAIILPAPALHTSITAEIWVSDRLAGRTVVQAVRLDPAEPSRGAVLLAVRAVELLKASLVTFWVVPSTPARRPASTIAQPLSGGAAPGAVRFALTGVALQGGAAMLGNPRAGGVDPVWSPVLRVSYGGSPRLVARLTASGLGTSARAQGAKGTARVGQELGLAELLLPYRAGSRIQPFASAGLGVYHLHLRGAAFPSAPSPALVDKTDSAWSLLSAAGAGAVVPLLGHVAAIFEGQALVAWPPVLVEIGGDQVGKAGWPSVLVSAGIMGMF